MHETRRHPMRVSPERDEGTGSWPGSGRVLLLVAAIGLSGGCAPENPELTPEEVEAVTRMAKPAAGELLRTLVGELTAAMEEGGPVQGVDLCSVEAIPLTERVEAGLRPGMEVKRTSFRYRNPDNAPDPAEQEALRHFEEVLEEEGSAPSSFVQRVSPGELRYYQPLFVGEVCLSCHGPPESMSPDVQALIQERYPEDLATGYQAGDFRGLVRVSVPRSLMEAESPG
jgi:hypothetical protein